VLAAGDRIPDVRVFDEQARPVDMASLADDGPYLLVVYLFDWTST
jgi:hypothetical protein